MPEDHEIEKKQPSLTVVVMAKAGVLGAVKTRLTRGRGRVSVRSATAIHNALFEATLRRVRAHVVAPDGSEPRWVLAMDDPQNPPPFTEGWLLAAQGEGDLGDRLDRLWRWCGIKQRGGSIVFFGIDCPDVPAAALAAIGPALNQSDAAIGPVSDGGYWTLACRDYQPGLLQGIDWGGPTVYDQTRAAAARLGLGLQDLTPWHDVDEPADLRNLIQRIATAQEPGLKQLAAQLNSIDLRNTEP